MKSLADIEKLFEIERKKAEKYTEFMSLDRALEYEEYKLMKSMDWYDQLKIMEKHLGKAGLNEYRMPVIRGGKSKYPLYMELYKKHNSKLGKSLR